MPIKKKTREIKSSKDMVVAILSRESIITEDSNEAKEFYNQSRFGTLLDDGKVKLSLQEALYLVEKNKLIIVDGRNKPVTRDTFLKKANKIESNFRIKYSVFKDMRDRGYIIKTALKFGADYRVYEPGEDHAKWIVYPVYEGESLTWHDFSAKNRVAHSTKKKLLVGCVDDEGDVTYWEIRWKRP